MYDHREVALFTELELRGECRTLPVSWGVIVVVIEARLADRDHRWVVQRFLDLCRHFRIPRRGLVRMHARSGGKIELVGECDGLLSSWLGIRDHHHVFHSARPGSFHHVYAIIIELFGAQVAMGIDEHPMELAGLAAVFFLRGLYHRRALGDRARAAHIVPRPFLLDGQQNG